MRNRLIALALLTVVALGVTVTTASARSSDTRLSLVG